MKAIIEFTGYFRMKTGREKFETAFDDESVAVIDLIADAEKSLEYCDFKVLKVSQLKDGVLVFFRNEKGGLERIFDLSVSLSEVGGQIVMANLMGGG